MIRNLCGRFFLYRSQGRFAELPAPHHGFTPADGKVGCLFKTLQQRPVIPYDLRLGEVDNLPGKRVLARSIVRFGIIEEDSIEFCSPLGSP